MEINLPNPLDSGIHPRVIQVSRRPGVADPDVRIILDNPHNPTRSGPIQIDPQVQVVDYRPAPPTGGDPNLRVSTVNLANRRQPTQQGGPSRPNQPPQYQERPDPPPPYDSRPGPSQQRPRTQQNQPTPGTSQSQPVPGTSQSRSNAPNRPRPNPNVFVNDPLIPQTRRLQDSPAVIAEADTSRRTPSRPIQPGSSPDVIEISPPNNPQIPVVTIDSSPDVPQVQILQPRQPAPGPSRQQRLPPNPRRPQQQPPVNQNPQPHEVQLPETPPASPPIRYDEAFPPLPNRLAPPFDPRRSQLYARRQGQPGNRQPTPPPPGKPRQ